MRGFSSVKPRPGIPLQRSHPLVRGLIARYLINEGAGRLLYEMVGHKNHAMLGATDPARWVGSIHGGALDFDGVDDYAQATLAPGLNGAGQGSIVAWFRTGTAPAGLTNLVTATATGGTISGLGLRTQNATQLSAIASGGFVALSTFNYSDGRWHQFASVYDGANLILYVDGVPLAATPMTGTLLADDFLLEIGRQSGASARYFTGQIDDVRVYSRALPPGEVAWLYADPYADSRASADLPGWVIPVYPGTGHIIELELNGVGGGWTSVAQDVLISPAIHLEYGIGGAGPTDLVASTGQLSYAHNNSEENSAGVLGYYTPDGVNCRPGFKRGIRVRYSYRVAGTNKFYIKFLGRLINADPTPGVEGERRTLCDAVDYMNELASFHPNVAMQLNKRADQSWAAVEAALATHPTYTSYDVADSTFPYSLGNAKSEASSALTEAQRHAQSEFGRIYMKGLLHVAGVDLIEGTMLRMEKRSARLVPQPLATFLGPQQGLTPTSNIKNRAKATAHPKRVDTTDTVVLYSKPSQSNPAVQPAQVIKMSGRYSDPTSRSTKVGGTDMRTPVASTDYLMNGAQDGTGADLTGSFTVVAVYGANQVEYTITNTGGTLGYITLLQARGRGIYDYDELDAVVEDLASIAQVGVNLVDLDMPYQSDAAISAAVAEFLVDTWVTPGMSEVRVRFIPSNEDEMDLAMSLEPGHPIALSEVVTGVNGVYYIQRVSISVEEPGSLKTVFDWLTQRALVVDYWQLGTAGFSELGITTILAPL